VSGTPYRTTAFCRKRTGIPEKNRWGVNAIIFKMLFYTFSESRAWRSFRKRGEKGSTFYLLARGGVRGECVEQGRGLFIKWS